MTIADCQGACRLSRLCLRLVRRRRHRGPPRARRSAEHRRIGQSEFSRSKLDRLPASSAAAGSADHGANGGIRRPRGRAQADAAGHFRRADARNKADVLRPLACRRRQCRFRRHHAGAGWQAARASRGCATICSRLRAAISGTARTASGNTSRSSAPSALPAAQWMSPPTSRRGFRCPSNGAAIGWKFRPARRTAPLPRSDSMRASMRRRLPTRPIFWKSRSTSRTTSRARR